MTAPDNRESGRSSVFLIVNFRPLKGSREYILGISNNFSEKGISIESQNSGYGPGEVLELLLKHPHSDMSVSVTGKIAWKNDGWYKSVMGIEYIDLDPETENRMSALISNVMESLPGSMLPDEYTVMPDVTEKEPADTLSPENTIEEPLPEADRTGARNISDKEYLVSAVSELNRSAAEKTSGTPKREHTQIPAKEPSPLFIKGSGQGKGRTALKPASSKGEGNKLWLTAAILVILLAASASFLFIENISETLLPYISEARSILSSDIYGKVHSPLDSPQLDAAYKQEFDEVQRSADGPETANAIQPAKDTDIISGPALVTSDTAGNIQDAEVEEEPAATDTVPAEAPSPDKEGLEDADIRAEITFSTNSTRIDPSFYPDIDKVTEAFSSDPGAVIRLESHTDNVGPGIYNIDLSMRRALAVKELLNEKGIRNRKIKIILFGDSSPIAANDTEYGRRKNRRVEIKVVHSAE